MKHLWLLRHATAGGGSPDELRRLTPRGQQESARVAARFAESFVTPDIVLCSPAHRTRETAETVTAGFDPAPEIEIDEGLYLAPPGEILRAIASIGPSCSGLLVVGHNPGLADLANELALAGGSAAHEMRARGFPPCALARFELDMDDWAEIDSGDTRLVDFSAEP